jgi:hypothetical protein
MNRMKNNKLACTVLGFFLIAFSLKSQQKDFFYNVLSPSYSFSYSKIRLNDSSEFRSISNGFSLNLFRYGYRIKNFEGSGGIGLHYISTKISESQTNLDIAFLGMAPELRVKYYPLTLEKGLFIGAGAQFFVLPLITSPNFKVNSIRPVFMAGMSKDFGFTLFCLPTMVTGKIRDVDIKKNWYLGMEIDIPWSRLF